MKTPEMLIADFESLVAGAAEKAASLQAGLAASTATVRSPDGVTVTVGPNGGLLDLSLENKATELGAAKLTRSILDAVRKAQRQASQSVLAAFQPFGDGTEAMQMVMDAMPDEPEEPETTRAAETADKFVPAALVEESAEPAPATKPKPKVATKKRRRPDVTDEDDSDYDNPW